MSNFVSFSVIEFTEDDLVIELTLVDYSDDEFNIYKSTVLSPDEAALNSQIADDFNGDILVPLCDHIMDYFLYPPEKLWVRISVPNE